MPLPTSTELKRELKHFVPGWPVLSCWLVLAAILLWSYAPALGRLTQAWWQQPDYGHGWFVPMFSLVLLWLRREMMKPLPTSGSWWGLAFLAVWVLMRGVTAYWNILAFDTYSMLPFLAGTALLIGGWRALHWSWPSIVFLGFMVPLVSAFATALRNELQWIATQISVFLIQTIGIAAAVTGEGSNVIQVPSGKLQVVEACSGLRMLMLFAAICVGAAFVIRSPLWQKIVILFSAVPIALFANVARITVTAVLYELARKWPALIDTHTADDFFHNWAGYFMMPLAMVILFAETALLDRLFLEPIEQRPLGLGGSLAGGLQAGGSGSESKRKKQGTRRHGRPGPIT